jgi:pimeloyl-ACP methyl ester carboxylesterase
MLLALLAKAFDSAIRLGRTSTPPVDSPGGIASLEKIDLNGYPQWLLIRGHDVAKPVLLFLHGGPGSSAIWFAHHSMRALERHFVCVNWDQRGAGKSYRSDIPPETMRLEQFVADAVALIELLLKRFGRRRLLLVGQSWGSVLAMKVAAARPDLLDGVVGVGQVVDMMRGERRSYDYVLECAHRSRNRRALRDLRRIGAPPYKGKDLFTQRRWLSEFNGDTWTMDVKGVLAIGLKASEYSLADCVRFFKGAAFSNRLLWNELMTVDLSCEIRELEIPVVFFVGRHDYTTPFELVQRHFAQLRAPSKKLVWFEDSGHMPNLEEPEKFQSELIEIGREVVSPPDRVEATPFPAP